MTNSENTEKLFGRPWLFIVAFAVCTLAFATFIPLVEYDSEDINHLPAGSKYLHNTKTIENIFGGTDSISIAVSSENILNPATLGRIWKITRQLENSREFDTVVSLFSQKIIKSIAGQMRVEAVIDQIPTDAATCEAYKEIFLATDSSHEKVLSEDLKHSVITAFINVNASNEDISTRLEKILADNPGDEEISISGSVFSGRNISHEIKSELIVFAPLSLLVFIIVLLILLRRLRAVMLSIALLILSIIPAWGLIFISGWKVQIATLAVPGLIILTCSAAGIHLLLRYYEDNVPGSGLSNAELTGRSLVSIGPVLMASGFITAAAMFGLLMFGIVPIRQAGIIATIGCAVATVGATLFIPAWLSVLPRPEPAPVPVAIEKFSGALARIVSAHTYKIFISTGVFAALAGTGLMLPTFEANPEFYFSESDRASADTSIIDRSFDGLPLLSLLVKGDIKDPHVLKTIDRIENELKRLPGTGSTFSIAGVVRRMNFVMHGDDPAYDTIPEDRQTISDLFMSYSLSGDAGDFNRLIDFSFQHAQVLVRLNKRDAASIRGIAGYINSLSAQKNEKTVIIAGGKALLFAESSEKTAEGRINSLAVSLFLAFLCTAALFRRLLPAILSAIPSVFSILLVHGLAGLSGQTLFMPSALLLCLSVPIGFDYGIQFLWRYKNGFREGYTNSEAVTQAVTGSARSILTAALPLLTASLVFLFADFLPVRAFGALAFGTLSSCLLGALLLLPAACLILRPSFSKRRIM